MTARTLLLAAAVPVLLAAPVRHDHPAYGAVRTHVPHYDPVSRAQVTVLRLCGPTPALFSFCPPAVVRRPAVPGFGADTTLVVGDWRGAPLHIRVRLDPAGWLDQAIVTAISRGRVVDWRVAEGSGLHGPVWSFSCSGALPDLDGDGLAEVGVPMGAGGGPFSVNVSVGVVRFDPAAGQLRLWARALTTPDVRGRQLVERYRGSGFGRMWSRTSYALPADSLVEVETVAYEWVEELSTLHDDMVWTRTTYRAGQPDRTRVVTTDDLPADEQEGTTCP